MEQVLSYAMLSMAIALLAVLMRMASRLSAEGLEQARDAGRSVHEVAIPVRVVSALATFIVLIRVAEVAQVSVYGVIGGVILMPSLAWLNAYVWQFRATLKGSDLTVMGPNFRTQDYDLTRLIEVRDNLHGTWGLRFQGGEGCWILKYLSGRNTLRQALQEAQPYY